MGWLWNSSSFEGRAEKFGKNWLRVWEERRQWIDKQVASCLSAAGFCREHGLHAGNFRAWKQPAKDARLAAAATDVTSDDGHNETRRYNLGNTLASVNFSATTIGDLSYT